MRLELMSRNVSPVSSPEMSVVVAAHNARRTLEETLRSVLSQTGASFEIIVIDDGSVDETASLARSLGDARITVVTTANRGVSRARNTGLWLARAPLVLFLDADDMLLPDALKSMVEAMREREDSVACLAGHLKIWNGVTEPNETALNRLRRLPERDTLSHLIAKNFIVNGGSLCIRTRVAREIGGFDATLKLGEDWEFWCRLAGVGDITPLRDQIALLYRQVPSGAQNTLRGTPDAPNFSALDAIFSLPAVQARFTEKELRKRRRMAELDTFWSAARNELAQRRWGNFFRYVRIGTKRYPDSLLHWHLVRPFLTGATRTLFRM